MDTINTYFSQAEFLPSFYEELLFLELIKNYSEALSFFLKVYFINLEIYVLEDIFCKLCGLLQLEAGLKFKPALNY